MHNTKMAAIEARSTRDALELARARKAAMGAATSEAEKARLVQNELEAITANLQAVTKLRDMEQEEKVHAITGVSENGGRTK